MIGARRSRLALPAAVLLLGLLPACSPSLPKPPACTIPNSDMIEVPYPPPPARVETIPLKKAETEVWIDGQWEWDGKGWKWREGAWTTPPADAYFTPWSTKRRGDGQLLFTRAEWRDKTCRPLNVDKSGQICSAPAPSAPADEATKQ